MGGPETERGPRTRGVDATEERPEPRERSEGSQPDGQTESQKHAQVYPAQVGGNLPYVVKADEARRNSGVATCYEVECYFCL